MKECKITEPFTIGETAYDLSDLEKVYRAWTPMFWTSKSLYKVDENEFLSVSRSPFVHDSNDADVAVLSRIGAIREAVRMNAPDDTLRELGVTIQRRFRAPEEYYISHPDTLMITGINPIPWYYDCLFRNFDGSYLRVRTLVSLKILWLREWIQPMSQREAILHTLSRDFSKEGLTLLGIEPD